MVAGIDGRLGVADNLTGEGVQETCGIGVENPVKAYGATAFGARGRFLAPTIGVNGIGIRVLWLAYGGNGMHDIVMAGGEVDIG